jgi:hypothetical protein
MAAACWKVGMHRQFSDRLKVRLRIRNSISEADTFMIQLNRRLFVQIERY